jgi:hypothetical protein
MVMREGYGDRGRCIRKTAKLQKSGGRTFLSGSKDRQECLSTWIRHREDFFFHSGELNYAKDTRKEEQAPRDGAGEGPARY